MVLAMALIRTWMSLVALVLAAPSVSAQSVFLAEPVSQGACFRNELTMRLLGTVNVQQNGQPVAIRRSADATHSYLERVIDFKNNQIERTARFYNRADATLVDGSEKFELALKANHVFLVAHRVKDQLIVYHPA